VIRIERGADVEGVALGVVHATGCALAPAPAELAAAIDTAVVRAAERDDAEPARVAVRDVLRHGKYKPTGRGKPASEYLLGAAREGRFPRISNLVDLNNLVSLETLLPISVVDLARAGTTTFALRRGREGEKYVFNPAGHEIELRDLLLVATLPDDTPCANAVKDSMRTKITDDTTDVAAFVYAPAVLEPLVREAVARVAEGLSRWCGARSTATAT
jgi:DNA/RNA-binding domain of Phe-tRNA-synthetase-like protein